MNTRTKRRVLSLLSLAFMATLVLLCATLMPNTHSAKAADAAPQNLKVDTLGFLRWDEVSGATSYEWSYSTGGDYVSGGTVEETEADISAAMTEAVKVARENGATSATLNLKVAADGQETVLTHTFDKYINYGYSTHDITDVYAPAIQGKTGTFSAHSALSMNQLLTFGFTFSATHIGTSRAYYSFGFMNRGPAEASSCFYRFNIEQHGWVKLYLENYVDANNRTYSFSMGNAIDVGEMSYWAVGAFDTYSLAEDKDTIVGETVYLRRVDVDDTGAPTYSYINGWFFDSATVEDRPTLSDTTKTPNNHTEVDNNSDIDGDGVTSGTIPKNTFAVITNDTASMVQSGKILADSGITAPSMVHYDSITGQVKWNEVEGATGYKWSYSGSNVWTTTTETYIDADKVAAAIENGEDYVRFAVRAVNENGKTSNIEYFALDLTEFYGQKAALKDISEIVTNLKNPSSTKLINPSTNAENYAYYNEGYEKNTFVEHAFVFNDSTSAANRLMINLHAREWGKFAGWYVLSIYYNGDITICRKDTQGASTNGRFLARPNAFALELGKKYIATYGVEELVNQSGAKVADRVTVKISEEVDGERKLLAFVSYDNYEYNWGELTVEYTTKINYNLSGSDNFKSTTEISCASLERDITYVMPEGVTHNNPATYTACEPLTLQAPTVPTGYVFEGWYFDEACTEEANITAETYSDLTVYAKLEALPTVTVLDKNGDQVSKEYVQDGVYTLPELSAGVIGYAYNNGLYNEGDTLEVTSDIEVHEVWLNLTMEYGASVRLSSANNFYGGMRFTINADSATVEKYGLKVFGVIVPTDDSKEDGFSWETVNGTELAKYSTEEGVDVYYATLTNVLYTNYNRQFSARGYVEVTYADGETVRILTAYTEEANSRSVYQVACLATADDAVTQDAKDVLANYLSYTVNVVLTDGVYSVATADVDGLPTIGERKYTVENNVLTLEEIPENLANVLAADRPYVPVSVWSADGTTYERILVQVTYDATSKIATATLPTTIE